MQVNDIQKIGEIARGVDQYLGKLDDFTKELRSVKTLLQSISDARITTILGELASLKEQMKHIQDHVGIEPINIYEKNMAKIKELLYGEQWPSAVSEKSLSKDDAVSIEMAHYILDMFVIEWLTDLKFLDFGCGNGYVTGLSTDRLTKLSVGFDLIQPKWANTHKNLIFTQNMKVVEENAPYDVILLYDVLDHLVGDPIEILSKIRSLLSPMGKIYVRNHPWCSANGGHLYHQINKAYIHLLFDSVELVRLGGYVEEPNIIKLTQPCEQYRYWFDKAGLEIKSEHVIIKQVPDFFTNPQNTAVRERLKAKWGDSDPFANMSLQFVDFKLESKEPNLNNQII